MKSTHQSSFSHGRHTLLAATVALLASAAVVSAQTSTTGSTSGTSQRGSSSSSGSTSSRDTTKPTSSSADTSTSGSSYNSGSSTYSSGTGSSDVNAGATSSSTGTGTMTGRSTSSEKLSWGDRRFVSKASDSGNDEIALAKLAADKATSSEVKSYAQKLVDDHQQVATELQAIASQKNVKVDKDNDHDRTYKRLSKMSGHEFDQEFVEHMIDDHEKDIKMFEKAARDAKDAEVRSFASKHVDHLREHLRMAESLRQTLMPTGRSDASAATRSSTSSYDTSSSTSTPSTSSSSTSPSSSSSSSSDTTPSSSTGRDASSSSSSSSDTSGSTTPRRDSSR